MDLKLIIFSFLLLMIVLIDGKKISIGRNIGSSRGGSRKTNYKPAPTPTSFSYPQQSQPKSTLFGWQEKSAKKPEATWQSKPSSGQSHSYPASQTGLSGQSPPKPNHSENIPKPHSYPSSQTGISGQNPPKSNPQENIPKSGNSHSYPASPTGLSGQNTPKQPPTYQESLQRNSGYPQQAGGLSGSGSGYQPQQAVGHPQYGNNQYNPGGQPPPYSGINSGNYGGNNYGNHYSHGPPPPYSNPGSHYGGHGSYHPSNTPQMPGYFGSYGNNNGFGGVSRTRSALTGVGIAGAGIGTVLTGLALWNLARSTGNRHHTVVYDNRGQPVAVAPANGTNPVIDPMLADLVNCTLTIANGNATEVIAIPCAIASSFSPGANIKDIDGNNNANDNTKCTVTVVNKTGKEYMTTIPCSTLLNTAAENNVTEPILTEDTSLVNNTTLLNEDLSLTNNTDLAFSNDTSQNNEPTALKFTGSDDEAKLNCTPYPSEIRDPINPCFSITHNLEVLPLSTVPSTGSTV